MGKRKELEMGKTRRLEGTAILRQGEKRRPMSMPGSKESGRGKRKRGQRPKARPEEIVRRLRSLIGQDRQRNSEGMHLLWMMVE